MDEKAGLHGKIAQLAQSQHGHVTRTQLLALGVAPSTITDWATRGHLIRVFAGVYAVGHLPRGPLPRAAAAVLAGGPGAVLSHESAAALYGLRRWPPRPEISTPVHVRRPGIRAHRPASLARAEVRTYHAIRTTTPARTIADIAARLSDRALARIIDDARLAGHLGPGQLQRLLASCPRARDLIDPNDEPFRSHWERDFRAFTTKYGLPTPQFNRRVAGHRVDALYPEEKLIIELDSWRFHQDRHSFETDRERDADTSAEGYLTLRLTWRRVDGQPQREADRIHRILHQRRREANL